jgi:ubiquinone/menaquinone biosynthesis C-methylase UbiE
MSASDAAFAGSIPGLYDQHLGPLLFEPFAREIAQRARDFETGWILETAAGTGIVTAALAEALPHAHIVATDLNPAMLDVAGARIASPNVRFEPADALDLPFEDASFDLAVCQFGVMFYPDRVRGNAEARRVLRDGGRYLVVVWDRIDRNPAAQAVHDAVARLYPDDPPQFLARTPYGYGDPAQIERDLRDAGFTDIRIDSVELRSSTSARPRDAARGFVLGSPLRSEIEQRDPGGIYRTADAVEEQLQSIGDFDLLRAHIAIATR